MDIGSSRNTIGLSALTCAILRLSFARLSACHINWCYFSSIAYSTLLTAIYFETAATYAPRAYEVKPSLRLLSQGAIAASQRSDTKTRVREKSCKPLQGHTEYAFHNEHSVRTKNCQDYHCIIDHPAGTPLGSSGGKLELDYRRNERCCHYLVPAEARHPHQILPAISRLVSLVP